MLTKRWEKTGVCAQEILHIAEAYADVPGTCLLYSGGNFSTSQRSFLFLNPEEIIRLQGPFTENPWDLLKQSIKLSNSEIPEWVGFLSYEMGAFSDHEIQHPYQPSEVPDAYFQKSATVIVHDKKNQTLTCFSKQDTQLISKIKTDLNRIGTGWEQDRNRMGDDTHPTVPLVGDFEMDGDDNYPVPILPAEGGSCSYPVSSVGDFVNDGHRLHRVSALETEESYVSKVNHAKELIYNGDIYQVNISQEIVCEGDCHPYTIFCNAMKLNPAPFAAYIKQTDFTVVCTSPERFLLKKGDQLETRPIKGTAPRGKNSQEDHQNREHLLNSPKETAELLMITDLMRNDLGRVSKPGTVNTIDLGVLEAFTNVFHKHAWIVSQPLELHAFDIIRACFPGGSITGCPKIKAMQVIAELEKQPRGLYTGSIGYVCGKGDFDFNIAIRTMVFQGKKVTVRLGGGIVADSDPIKEYQETLHKGKTIFKALGISLFQNIDV